MKQDVSVLTVPRQTPRQRLPVLPCHVGDPDLWFADTPGRSRGSQDTVCELPDQAAVLGRGASAG